MEELAVAKEEVNEGATEPNALELGAAARAAGEEKLVDVEKHADADTQPESPAQDSAPAQPVAIPEPEKVDALVEGGDVAGIPPGAHLDAPARRQS